MLTAVAVVFVSVGCVGVVCAGVGMRFGKEAGAAPRRGFVLCVKHPGSGAIVSQR